MLTRIWSLIVKELIHLRRDAWMPAFMLFGGVMELLLVGWATSRPITNLPLMVIDQDQSAASRELIGRLQNTTTFAPDVWPSDLDAVEIAFERGKANAALIIPPSFDADLASATGQPTIMVLLNGTESVAATAALRAVDGLVADLNEEIALQRIGLDAGAFQSFSPSVRVWFNEALSEALYTVPAELALMLEFTVLVFAALAFSRERELGTLEQLLVKPFSSLEIIIGKSAPSVVIGVVDFILMLTMVHFVFDVPVRGSLLLLLVLALGYVMVELSKGLVISVMARTQHQAFLLVFLVGMTDFMFTGYATPVEAMPAPLQFLSNFIPANHWLTILRGILLKGVGLEVLWPNALALSGLAILLGIFSARFIRRALN